MTIRSANSDIFSATRIEMSLPPSPLVLTLVYLSSGSIPIAARESEIESEPDERRANWE